MENEVFFCCVYQSLSDFFLGETFSSRRSQSRDEKDLIFKKKKKTTKTTRERRESAKKNTGEIQRDFETRDTFLRENKRAIFYSFFEMLLF